MKLALGLTVNEESNSRLDKFMFELFEWFVSGKSRRDCEHLNKYGSRKWSSRLPESKFNMKIFQTNLTFQMPEGSFSRAVLIKVLTSRWFVLFTNHWKSKKRYLLRRLFDYLITIKPNSSFINWGHSTHSTIKGLYCTVIVSVAKPIMFEIEFES